MKSSNLISQEITPGISLITAVKNRTENLRPALESWICHQEIDEIVVVDWESDESLIPFIASFHDDRIVLVIAENQKRWIQTQAFNLAARFSSRSMMMKIDGDVIIRPGFFSNHTLTPNTFYTGNWAIGRDANEMHLNGTAFFFRDDFFRVNGYNEFLKLYGYDDTDLYTRLEHEGLKRVDFNNDFLLHIEHEERVSAVELTDYVDKLSDAQKADLSILMNRYFLNSAYAWNQTHPMLEMKVKQTDKRVFSCLEVNPVDRQIPPELLETSLKIALQERLQLSGQDFSRALFDIAKRDELIDLYYLYQHSHKEKTFENILNLLRRYDRFMTSEVKKQEEDKKQQSWQNRLRRLFSR